MHYLSHVTVQIRRSLLNLSLRSKAKYETENGIIRQLLDQIIADQNNHLKREDNQGSSINIRKSVKS